MSGIYAVEAGIAGICQLICAHYSQILLDSLNEIKKIQSKGLKTLMMMKGGVDAFKTELGITSSGITPSEIDGHHLHHHAQDQPTIGLNTNKGEAGYFEDKSSFNGMGSPSELVSYWAGRQSPATASNFPTS